jgi:hypothetical protein
MGPHGFMHAKIFSHAVIAMRKVIYRQNQQVSMVGVSTTTTAFSHQISDQTGKESGDAIVAPTSYIHGVSNQPIIMQLVQQALTCKHQQALKNKKEDALPLMRR